MKKFVKKSFGILWLMRIPIVSVSILLALISLEFTNTYNFCYVISLACVFVAGYIQNDILDF